MLLNQQTSSKGYITFLFNRLLTFFAGTNSLLRVHVRRHAGIAARDQETFSGQNKNHAA
jgi:hypothetical protein